MSHAFTERYLVAIQVSTTGDEHQVFVTKDRAEIIELAWCITEAKTMDILHSEAVLIRPSHTPVTDLCTSATHLTWADLEHASTLKEAIHKFDDTRKRYSKGEQFSFLVMNTFDLKVQLDRETRDKNIALPLCLQYPRLYDLRREYSTWQLRHPEALRFSPPTLLNMCTALNIDFSKYTDSTQVGLPHFVAAQSVTAQQTCTLLTAIAKELSTSDCPLLFSQPIDARADIDAFLQETSKIVHLSRLAHDTTQSELESWFTQHNARPIALWTLRTPDHEKPYEFGYAVFSTHAEALDALSLNGRALNDRTIQVSPSSSLVLDRARSILVPFPTSKNRPRPGDWTCPACGFSNFERRTACFRCSCPSTSERQVSRVMYRVGDWTCSTCQFHNFARNAQCLKCGAGKD